MSCLSGSAGPPAERCLMRVYDLLTVSNKNLWRRKGRTILTIVGVIIGVASIVVMLSLGIGLVESQKEMMAQWGSLNIIRVNQSYSFPGDPNSDQQRKLNDAAIEEIRAMAGVVGVSPAFDVWGDAKWGKKSGYLTVIGVDPSLMELLEFEVQAGRLLTADDRFNVVAGSQVVNNFWDEQQRMDPWAEPVQNDPLELLDQRLTMTIFNQQQQKRIYNLYVVGILSEKTMERAWEVYAPLSEVKRMRDFMNQGQQQFVGYEEVIKVPAVTPSRRQQREEEQYSFALVATEGVEHTRRLSRELRDMGYNAWSMADNLEGIEETARRFQAILGGIGAITLLVAAIGITNTMVMSIYERTREIAIIKVIGASFADIRLLFLTESSLIGVLGGSFGLGLSFALSSVLNKYGSSFISGGMVGGETLRISLIPPWLVVFALVFSFGIGLVSGLYPANRAIKLDPITALRHY